MARYDSASESWSYERCQACAAPRKDEICQTFMSTEKSTHRRLRGATKRLRLSPPARPLVTAKDIYEVPRLAVQGMLAWSLAGIGLVAAVAALRWVNAATHPERNAQGDSARHDSSPRHAASDRPASPCRRELGQSLRGALPISARLAPRRLGAGRSTSLAANRSRRLWTRGAGSSSGPAISASTT